MPAKGTRCLQITAHRGTKPLRRRALQYAGGGSAMSQPTPYQTLAVHLALRRFHQRYPCPCADHREWKADCERIAWCAVLEATHAIPRICPPHPLTPLFARQQKHYCWTKWETGTAWF